MNSETFPFTGEQKRIINLCPRPHKGRKKGIVFRVTAAAGSGKTTTLLGLAKEATNRNHQSLTYCTFTKAAANDGLQRIMNYDVNLSKVRLEARTIHSLAALVLNENEEENSDNHLYDENRFKKWLNRTLEKEINTFLQPCEAFWSISEANVGKRKSRLKRARDQVQHFIYKNFTVNFCHSSWSLEIFEDHKNYKRVYYPVVKFYKEVKAEGRTKAHSYGLHVCQNKDFFADMAVLAWKKALEENIATHDIRMKRAQLGNYEIPGSIILVDESQDMDECQVAFCVTNQVKYGKVVYMVGDPAQTIFGFRGAKAKNLMNMMVNRSLPLTQSWRFGPAIAKVANVVLYAKEYSPQTEKYYDGRNMYWDPYRISAGQESLSGVVTDQQIVKSWNTYEGPVTVIARANAQLMMEALTILGFEFPDEDEEGQEENKRDFYESDEESLQAEFGSYEPIPIGNGVNAPKIHLYGNGESSGKKGWKKVINMVEEVYMLYELSKEQGARQLSSAFHPEFFDRKVTWNEYIEDCKDKELAKYTRVNHIVFKYKSNTMKAVKAFEEHVMNKDVPESEANIILTTCHSAKGMEWPHVQVCEDFLDPCRYEKVPIQREGDRMSSPDKGSFQCKWRFKFKAYGNEVNMLYVACTRAMKTLSLPEKFWRLLRDFDRVTEYVRGCQRMEKESSQEERGGDGGFYLQNLEEKTGTTTMDFATARRFHQDLVEPLRREMKLAQHEKLTDSIMTASPPPTLMQETDESGPAEHNSEFNEEEKLPPVIPQVSQEFDITSCSVSANDKKTVNNDLSEGVATKNRASLPFVTPDDHHRQFNLQARPARSLLSKRRLEFPTGTQRDDNRSPYRKKR